MMTGWSGPMAWSFGRRGRSPDEVISETNGVAGLITSRPAKQRIAKRGRGERFLARAQRIASGLANEATACEGWSGSELGGRSPTR